MEEQLLNVEIESLQVFKNLSLECKGKSNGSGPASCDEDQPLDIKFVEKILNYEFKDKSLLLQAFTDSSYGENCDSYERLEYIGDSVLNLIVSKYFYHRYSDLMPGELTNLRAINVDTEKLARAALKHNLHLCLRHKKPLLEDQILTFSKEIEKHPLHSRGLLKVPKVLADIVESTIGALFIDCCNSTNTVWKIIKPLLEPIITSEKYVSHPMTQLNEMCQKKNLKLRFDDSTWEDDRNVFVFIEDHLVGRGNHLLKKDSARNCAAKNAIDNFTNFSF